MQLNSSASQHGPSKRKPPALTSREPVPPTRIKGAEPRREAPRKPLHQFSANAPGGLLLINRPETSATPLQEAPPEPKGKGRANEPAAPFKITVDSSNKTTRSGQPSDPSPSGQAPPGFRESGGICMRKRPKIALFPLDHPRKQGSLFARRAIPDDAIPVSEVSTWFERLRDRELKLKATEDSR